jgi:hypothetical protein
MHRTGVAAEGGSDGVVGKPPDLMVLSRLLEYSHWLSMDSASAVIEPLRVAVQVLSAGRQILMLLSRLPE